MNFKVLFLVIALASQTYCGPLAAGICYAGEFHILTKIIGIR